MRFPTPDIRPREAALAVALAAFQAVGSTFASHGQPDRRGLDALAYALLIGGPLLLMLWRSHAVGVLAAVSAVTVTYLAIGYAYGPVVIAQALALIAAIVTGHRVYAIAAGIVVYAVMVTLDDDGPSLGPLVGVGAWLVVVLGAGEVVRARRERRAEMIAARREESRRRAGEERLQIARELHDVLAHSLSLINVQAGVALHLIDERPEQARTALAAITEVSREALGEVRSTLGALRTAGDEAPRAPAASLRDLDALLDRVRAAGLRVDARIEGDERPLPAGVDQAAFRIVQEALTNVRRHGGGAAAAVVVLDYRPRELRVRVADDGAGAPGAPLREGGGIQGMRERALALGGRLAAGARPEGGFAVEARLPLEAS